MLFTSSRYLRTPLHNQSKGTLVLGTREKYKFNLKDATMYTVIQGDSIDGIAHKLYGNAQLWWAIMDSNPKYQSELDIKAGDHLVIPPYKEVVKVSE